MNEKIAKIILGSVAISLLIETTSQYEYNCKVFEEDKILQGSCKKNEKVKTIPQDLDVNIKKLDMSDNTLSNIAEDQFKRYVNLETLLMIGVTSTFNLSLYYLFRPLQKLTTLRLDYSHWNWVPFEKINNDIPSDTVFYWPPNLKNLTVSYAWIWFLDLSNLKHLEYLDARENVIRIFPTFNPLTPLKYLNLSLTRLTRMRAEDLAPLCSLEVLHVTFFDNYRGFTTPELIEPEKYCECQRIDAWVKQFGIKGVTPACKPRSGETCDLKFSDDTLSVRKACFSKRGGGTWFPVFLILLVIAMIIGASVSGYLYWKRNRESKNDDSSFE